MSSSVASSYYDDQVKQYTQWLVQAKDLREQRYFKKRLAQAKVLRSRLEAVVQGFEERGFGLILQSSRSYAVILEDPSVSGSFRYQEFDENGFYGHSTRKSIDEVLLEAFLDGYRDVAEDQRILDTLSLQESWKRGMHAVDLVRQVNCSSLTYRDACQQFAAAHP
jgi:hypothetical protein